LKNTACEPVQTNPLGDMVSPLLAWYDENARVLPWRRDLNPYRVWVSEIMLQQTRVEAVIPYYHRFLRQFPDIQSLAEADEEKLLKLWEGLGYYRRAKNLHKAAQEIMENHGGRFPKEYRDIRALPGIGDYTAGAIASICFGQPVPAVDGNVLRVIARLTGCRQDVSAQKVKRNVANLLEAIYPATRCGDFTQALMELGAVICLPNGVPKCGDCPLHFMCYACQTNTQMSLPVKSKKPPRKKEEKTVFLLRCGDRIAIRQREAGALLGGLWEFPNAEGNLTPAQAQGILTQWKIAVAAIAEGLHRKHVFTHVEWSMVSYVVSCENMPDAFSWVTKETLLAERTLPSAFRPFLSLL
jgi:A/G-specific adenine glycosylase